VTLQMDLSKSSPPSTVNQMGFVLKSTCIEPTDSGGGGATGAAGAAGTGNPGQKTVVLFDNIQTTCE
jgi:hypothetical protein